LRILDARDAQRASDPPGIPLTIASADGAPGTNGVLPLPVVPLNRNERDFENFRGKVERRDRHLLRTGESLSAQA